MREELQLFIVEGEKMVNELIASHPEKVKLLCYTAEFDFSSTAIENYLMDDKQLAQISSLKTPNKALAVVHYFKHELPTTNEFYIALDGIQDPGNLGTILRIADWYGVQHILCSEDTVDFYNSKVVQASMGAILRIQIHVVDLKNYFSTTKLPIYGALLEGENVYQSILKKQGILLMGNEGSGISMELLPYITNKISIPRFGAAESLNVAVATGILVSEFMRS
ncbi:MAG: RNA methyltransferase [Bacteroidota bacterium]